MEQNKNGSWAVAQSPILVTTVTLERLRKRGYELMPDHYFKVSPALNEPLYTRPVQPVPMKSGYSGVRGAPHHRQVVRPSTRLFAVAYSL